MRAIFAVRDAHNVPPGRMRAQGMLQSGGIQVFFIEWAHAVNVANIAASFAGLNPNDAAPSLQVLATIAIAQGIPVVSCDLTAAETVNRLDIQNPGYAPHNALSAFQPWGQAVRDRHVAQTISTYMHAHLGVQRGLVMFGANHFLAHEDRNAPPLHKLIKQTSEIDCFLVDNNSVAVNF